MADTMAVFKLKRLHLHLTEAPDWQQPEIKQYPISPP